MVIQLFLLVTLVYMKLTKLVKGVSHTDPKGLDFALRVMKRLRAACDHGKKTQVLHLVYTEHLLNHYVIDLQELIKKNLAISRMLQIRVIILILTMLMFVKRLMLSANLLLKVSSSLFLQVVLFHMLKYLTCVTTLKLLKN